MKSLKSIVILAIVAMMGILTTAQVRTLEIYQNGVVSQSIPVANVDSLKVVKTLAAPTSVTAAINSDYVQVTWNAVSGSDSYEVYRSSNNSTYTCLSRGITSTSYTDKSPAIGLNYYKIKAISNQYGSAISIPSSPITFSGTSVESGLYMGIIGFNDALNTKAISILASNTQSNFTYFVNNLSTNNDGTVLYYAVDNAINEIAKATLPSDLFSVSVVTFTDGLDVGSTDITDYSTGDQYLAVIKDRINTLKIQGNAINAYSIGFKGKDINATTEARFENNLKNLASKDENAYKVSSMSELNATFQEIANQLITISYNQTITLETAAPDNGQKIRFTFDIADNDYADATKSEMYIEGTYSKEDKSLKNVVYKGLKSSSGNVIVGEKSGLVKYRFKFEDFSKEDGGIIDIKNISILDFRYDATAFTWQKNSEFSGRDNVTSTEHRKSAVVMLVLDCSGSLGSDFINVQTYANDFIVKISEGTTPSTGNTEGPSNNVINGHEYVDLGLPSGLKWATCNVGAINPEDYGNYYAWGEITTKSYYCFDNSTTDGKTMGDISGNAEYDAAQANWGGTWRMPNDAEFTEMRKNCTWEWMSQNGVNGYKVTGPNGNSIFLPAAGNLSLESLENAGSYGYYWSSTPYDSGTNKAYGLLIEDGIMYKFNYYERRYYGHSVRPVTE